MPVIPFNQALVSPHFTRKELECHHCNLCQPSLRLIAALELLRSRGPEPIIVHDCCRCAIHNRAVGGVPNSEHEFNQDKDCEAVDFEIKGLTLQQMFERTETVPDFYNGGIGVYDGAPFVHGDVRSKKARWGRVKGHYVADTQLVHNSRTADPHDNVQA